MLAVEEDQLVEDQARLQLPRPLHLEVPQHSPLAVVVVLHSMVNVVVRDGLEPRHV